MTLAELIKTVRSILREPIPARWTDDDIKRYLNNGLLDLATLSEKDTTKEIAVVAETPNIDLTDDMLSIHTVYLELDDEFKELEPGIETLPKSKAKGLPDKYYIVGDSIELRPIPDVDIIVKVAYIKKPAFMEVDTDKPELRNSSEALIAYGAWQAFLEDGSPYTQIWEAEYAKRSVKWLSFDSDNYQQAFMVKGVW